LRRKKLAIRSIINRTTQNCPSTADTWCWGSSEHSKAWFWTGFSILR